ncbi:MAG TPA: glycerol kinase GlpK [Kiritimatiellia bacterium]|nr:glycerol kinase GlpK [Kiritimatiellia bacterium]HMO99925.1 glycerol kinase GlpK [Kiritimatiellia bacterium]
MKYLLALDQGTTSSRAMLVDETGRMVRVAQQEFSQHYPQPGWVEHDPEEIWRAQEATMRSVLAAAGVSVAAIAAVGITNQRETTVIWNRRTGAPIAPAIVWQDRRTAAMCDRLRADGLEDMFRQKTGLLLDPYFSGTKIRWLLDHIEGAREQAERGELAFGTIDAWLIWKLTGGASHVTDLTNAGRTLLVDLAAGTWDEALLAALEIPAALLPTITPSSGEISLTDVSVLGRALPITGIAGDQQAALFGQACFEPGMIKNTYGTGCFLLMNTGSEPVASAHKLLTTPAWRLGADAPVFALEGSVFSGGSVVQWLRDQLGFIEKSADVEALAQSVPDNGGVVLVPAFTGLGAPVWDASARGLLIGLTRGATRAHIARAALESIAFQVADVVDCMQRDATVTLKELRVDGGAAVNNSLMQWQADLLGIPVIRPANTESTAMGAAYLAGLGAGMWKTVDELAHVWRMERVFEPRIDAAEREERLTRWRMARDRAGGWA